MKLNSATDLDVYKKAYQLAMTNFRRSKTFPHEERFALTGQIRGLMYFTHLVGEYDGHSFIRGVDRCLALKIDC
jgi:hypothetical protein